MVIDPTTLAAVVTAWSNIKTTVSELYTIQQKSNHNKDENFNQMHITVMKAINSTRTYLADYYAGNRNIETESQLTELWLDASSSIKKINPRLGADFAHKSNYWADPTHEESKKNVRKLDAILSDIAEIIDPERKISPSEDKFTSLHLNE